MRYPADVEKIIEVGQQNNIEISEEKAEELWKEYSDGRCASWLSVDEYADWVILNAIREYIESHNIKIIIK